MNPYRKLRRFLWRLSVRWLKRGPRFSRYYAYSVLRYVGNNLPNREGRVLAIGHSEKLAKVLNIKATDSVSANYPEYNILNLDFPDASFDFVVSDQVLEHVEGDPFQAVNECYRVLRPGGIAVHTSSLLIPIHKQKGMGDFWRFTPDAFSLLHRNWSEIINVGSWGSRKAFFIMAMDWIRYLPVPKTRIHPLHRLAMKNDLAWPITVWVVASK